MHEGRGLQQVDLNTYWDEQREPPPTVQFEGKARLVDLDWAVCWKNRFGIVGLALPLLLMRQVLRGSLAQ